MSVPYSTSSSLLTRRSPRSCRLTSHDRALLRAANANFKRTILTSTITGLAFGFLAALAIRTRRTRVLATFNAVPAAAALLRPPFLERAATFTLMPFGGMAVGGVIGGMSAQADAVSRVTSDPDACARIEKCWLRVTEAFEGERAEAGLRLGMTAEQRLRSMRFKAVVGMLGAFRGSE